MQHVRLQGLIGKSLVEQFMNSFVPVAVGSSWVDIPGAFAMTVQQVHQVEGTPKNPPRVFAIIDFSVPNSRDALKLPQIAQAVATIFKNVGPEYCALLAHMPAFAKEDSATDPLDDDVTIKTGVLQGWLLHTAACADAPKPARLHRVHSENWRLAC